MKQVASTDTFTDLLCDLKWQWWKWRITHAVWHEMIKKNISSEMKPRTQVQLHIHVHFVMYSLKTSYYGSLLTTAVLTMSRQAFRILTTLYAPYSDPHCGSCPLCNTSGSQQKSTLSSYSRSQRVSTGWCWHLHKLLDHQPPCLRRPTYWTHFSIFSQLSSITNPLPSHCTHTGHMH